MPKSRPMASLFLMALLVFTPLLRAHAAMPLHSGHASPAATQHDNHRGSGAQHTPGKSVCAQNFSIVAFQQVVEDARLPVLTPIEPRLISTPLATWRERPPRTLSLI